MYKDAGLRRCASDTWAIMNDLRLSRNVLNTAAELPFGYKLHPRQQWVRWLDLMQYAPVQTRPFGLSDAARNVWDKRRYGDVGQRKGVDHITTGTTTATKRFNRRT